jgi:hypothetical protein
VRFSDDHGGYTEGRGSQRFDERLTAPHWVRTKGEVSEKKKGQWAKIKEWWERMLCCNLRNKELDKQVAVGK